MNIRIDGVEELQAKLRLMGGNSPEATHRGLMQGGKVVQGAAKKLCQVDTGELRRSIVVESPKKLTVSVQTNCDHAIPVEFGTGSKGDSGVAHTTKEKWSYQDAAGVWHTTRGQEPQPFLGPALHLSEQAVKGRVSAELKKAIREASRHG